MFLFAANFLGLALKLFFECFSEIITAFNLRLFSSKKGKFKHPTFWYFDKTILSMQTYIKKTICKCRTIKRRVAHLQNKMK